MGLMVLAQVVQIGLQAATAVVAATMHIDRATKWIGVGALSLMAMRRTTALLMRPHGEVLEVWDQVVLPGLISAAMFVFVFRTKETLDER